MALSKCSDNQDPAPRDQKAVLSLDLCRQAAPLDGKAFAQSRHQDFFADLPPCISCSVIDHMLQNSYHTLLSLASFEQNTDMCRSGLYVRTTRTEVRRHHNESCPAIVRIVQGKRLIS